MSQFVEDERLKGIDTVIMVESLEHILPKHFNPIYHRIMEEFKTQGSGHMIITNWIDYHPIPVGWMAPPEEHCRLTDDDLYDTMIEDFGKCIHREGSHLVLEWRD